MATKGGFDPDDPLPLFLVAREPERGIGISLRGLKASILVAMVLAIGVAAWVGNPVADVTALLVDKSAPLPDTEQSAPTTQSAVTQPTAEAEPLPPPANDAPTREITVSEPASQVQKENDGASLEALFKEFQTWAAEQDARALAKPIQADPAPVVANPPARVQKQRRARTIIRNARAEIRRVREARARVQNQPVQNAEAPSFLETLNPFAASPPQR
jgi:hypothetical protein